MTAGPLCLPRFYVQQTSHTPEMADGRRMPQQVSSGHCDSTASRGKHNSAVAASPRRAWYLPFKHAGDFLFAIGLLALSFPVILLGALLVKLTSRGPAFYRQVRVGKDGRLFTLLKLRTMRQDAEAETGPVWSTGNDPRVTCVGKLLRHTHIDEFPQLWNVALGQMSLVGPRPERPEFVARLDQEIPFYRHRLKVRPGITGLAQMRLPPDASLECVRRKLVHDVYYVQHVNPAIDLKLLVLTAWRLVNELGRYGWRCFTLPAAEEIEQAYRHVLGIPNCESEKGGESLDAIADASKDTVAEMPRQVGFEQAR